MMNAIKMWEEGIDLGPYHLILIISAHNVVLPQMNY